MESSGGMKPPTIYDVAKHAGVSIASVSRVLNRDHTRPATREKVLAAVQELGFVPDGAARGLSRGSKQIVGLVFARTPAEDALMGIEERSLLFTDSVIRGAESSAHHLGYSLLMSGAGAAEDGVVGTTAAIAALTGKVDGLILLDRVLPEQRVAPFAKRFPIVLLAGSGRSRSAVTVRVDNAGAMHAMADHLVNKHGLRRMAFVSGFVDSPDSSTRAEALASALSGLGGTCEPLDEWSADFTSTGALYMMQRRLAAATPLPQAIVCANDQMAIGVLHALTGAGFAVPEDVAVVGFDDIPVASYLNPPLTTVRQPSRQLGAAAVEAVVSLVEGRGTDREVVLPTELIVRASCGCGGPTKNNRYEPAQPMVPWDEYTVLQLRPRS